MAIPIGTKILQEKMDPYDIVDYEVDLSGLLESGETLATTELVLPTESSLLGLTIKTTGGYTTSLTGNILKFYLGIADINQSSSAFTAGATLPIEVRATTNAVPLRRKQRTIAVEVVQR